MTGLCDKRHFKNEVQNSLGADNNYLHLTLRGFNIKGERNRIDPNHVRIWQINNQKSLFNFLEADIRFYEVLNELQA